MPTKAKSTKSAKPAGTGDKRSTASKPRAASESTSSKPSGKPQAPVETLSLIDEEEKKSKKKATKEAPALRSFSSLKKLGSVVEAPSAKSEPEANVEKQDAAPVADLLGDVESDGTGEEAGDAKVIHLKPPIIVKDLAAALDLKAFQLIQDLMEINIFASINQNIDSDVAAKICEKHGFVFEKERRVRGEGVHKPEPVVAPPPEPVEVAEEELSPRAPIVTIMGHVDHGKTSLLDTIRKARVTASEAGGITQHIGAYSVPREGQLITFVDTPGHAAFTAMRARGASITDIVILVVAADDGLMPQTIEAINHAKAADAPIIVAINKIDLKTANPDRVKQQLQEHGLVAEDWGGDTICCPVSATKGTGIDDLLSMILLQAEVMELKASRRAEPRAVIVEAEFEAGRGPTATVIVKMGTIKVGQAFICGNHWGKVKQLIDDSGKPVREAGPATPVKVLGFNGLPEAGEELVVMGAEKSARSLSEERMEEIRLNKLQTPKRATLENLFADPSAAAKELRLVVKADVQGSLEAIVSSLEDIDSEKISPDLIHAAVGPISESDVLLASASDAVIIGFGVKVENNALAAGKREGVQIKLFSIIYELIDQVKEAMAGMLDPEIRESVIGHAEVKQVFDVAKGRVGGCLVMDGRISRSARARVLRKRQAVYDGGIATLRRYQDEVKEVRAGVECGIKLGDFNEYEPGDIIECYTLEKVAQQL